MLLSSLLEKQLSLAFQKYGKFVARNAVFAITICILLNCLLGINIIWIESNSDLETVYTPTNSQAKQDSAVFADYFPDFSGTNFNEQSLRDLGRYGSLIILAKMKSGILNSSYKNEIRKVFKLVENVTIKQEDQSYSYKQLCAIRNNSCAVYRSVLFSDYFWEQVRLGNVTFPTFIQGDGRKENLVNSIGGVDVKAGMIRSAKAIKMFFYLRQDSPQYKSLAEKWEQEFLNVFRSAVFDNFSIAYAVSESLGQELDSNTDSDVTYFSLSFTLMITYASFVAAGGNCVSQRGHLGRAGVIASGLAILGAFGLGSALQIQYVNIVGVMPFLIIGIGVDDMFILMSGLAESPTGKSVEDRIGKAVQSSGVAVTITSLTNVTAFAVGTLSSFQSVRNFCSYCGIAVFLCYVNQMTFFLGCMSIHERRVAANRHCVTCLPVQSEKELEDEGAGSCKIACCSGSRPSTRSDQESFLEKIPTIILPRLVLWLPVKIFVLLGFCAYVGLSIWGTIHLKQGLLLRNLVSESSYYHFYSNWDYDYFPSTFVISFISTENDYSSLTSEDRFRRLFNNIRKDPDTDDENDINWLTSYMSSASYTNSSQYMFCKNLKTFLSKHEMFSNDVQFSRNCTITRSRFHVLTRNIKDSYGQGELMLRMRKIAKESQLNVFAFSPAFIYFEQYVAVLPNTLQTVGISVAAVFVVSCIFLSHPVVILFVTVSMATIMLGLFGFMHIWGLSLSSITMIHVIMSVGFSVDYSAHICHAFLIVKGDNRNSRVSEALIRSGGPIFNGAVSSMVGIITLAFSESYVFTSFFKVMILVILFGLGQAVLFLPVVLSLVGPHHNHTPKVTKQVLYENGDMSHINKGFTAE